MTSTSTLFPFPPTYPFDLQHFPTPPSTSTFDPSTTSYLDACTATFAAISHQPTPPAQTTTSRPRFANTNLPAYPNRPSATTAAQPQRHTSDLNNTEALSQSISSIPAGYERQMYTTPLNSMGGPVTHSNRGIKRTRDHERTPSASTIASNGPASPYMQNGSHPHVANTGTSPNSPAYYADQSFSKNLPTPSQTPTQIEFSNSGLLTGQFPNAHMAMKDFGMQHHSDNEYPTELAPSRQSMSSYGNNSPATPDCGVADIDTKAHNMPVTGETCWDAASDMMDCLLFPDPDLRQPHPGVQLYRTESEVYQDELFVPNAYTSMPASAPKSNPSSNFLSPHRNLMAERLNTANLQRSASPTSAVSRERSPFRDTSLYAQANDWNPVAPVGTAAHMRQQQKEQSEQAEYARHPPQLRREPTKTISPKDALLDYNPETDQMPLFQDSVPVGYEPHRGGTEQWSSNYNAFGGQAVTNQQSMGFRHANPADTGYTTSGFDFLPQQGSEQIQSNAFQANYQSAASAKMNSPYDTPDFPAPLPSMETSASDFGPGQSSQEEQSNVIIQRPVDTRANTGAYPCSYHGCYQRFDSQPNLQKHKREVHRPQQQQPSARTSPSVDDEGSASPPSAEGSPAPSGSAMSSAAILARNSQAGPHRCTRINPSTNKPCNTIFSRPYDLTRHEDTIHNNRKQKVRCSYCREEKTFSRNDALTRHMRVVHPDVPETGGRRGRRGD